MMGSANGKSFNASLSGIANQAALTAKEQRALERKRKAALKAQQKELIKKYTKVKQMTIDYYCREDLPVTTLKEFFEIFISSLKKE